MEEKNQKLKGRLEALERPRQEDEPKFSTPDATNKKIEISKEAARPQSAYLGCQSPKEAARPPPQNPGQAETTKEAADPPGQRAKGGGDSSFTEKSMEFMALMMEPMKEMQKIMNEGKEETGVVRGVETIRSGSPDLPLLAAWEPQQGPLILGDWLLLVEPIVADLLLFTGASFAPGSEESHGSFVVLWGSSPVFWRSGRQGFVTLSTAEAELTDIIEGMVAGESIHVILQEVFPDVPKVLKTDNMPALSILTGDGGSWRTRHLRLRAAYARQSVSAGEWTLQHVPGEFMVADIGTKPLTAARFEFLKVCMGMGKLESKSEVEVEEGKERKEGEKKEEKKEQDGQLANKEKKRLAKTAQALRLITLAASIAVTKAEEEQEAEEAFSFEVILIYTLAIIVLTLAAQRLPGMQQCGGLRSCDSVLWLNLGDAHESCEERKEGGLPRRSA